MNVLILGAGRVGALVARLLADAGDFKVRAADVDERRLSALDAAPTLATGVETVALDATRQERLNKAMKGTDAVIAACPFYLNPGIAEAAREAGAAYLDLSEDMETTRQVRNLADGATRPFVPQCGVAPGFVNIAARGLLGRLQPPLDVTIRVGALPLYPANRLKYGLTWNTDGLIGEVTNSCEAIRDGAMATVAPLEGLEQVVLDGQSYEAFNTAGSLGTLCDTLVGAVRSLTFKTIRYPGHLELLKFLLEDLGMARRRDLLKTVLENALPVTEQDVVLVFVTVTGSRDGRVVQEAYVRKILGGGLLPDSRSALQTASAASVCAILDLIRDGSLTATGFVRQEDVGLEAFLANRFGRVFA